MTQKFNRQISELINQANDLERTISKFVPLSHLIEAETQWDKHDLLAAGHFLGALSSKTS